MLKLIVGFIGMLSSLSATAKTCYQVDMSQPTPYVWSKITVEGETFRYELFRAAVREQIGGFWQLDPNEITEITGACETQGNTNYCYPLSHRAQAAFSPPLRVVNDARETTLTVSTNLYENNLRSFELTCDVSLDQFIQREEVVPRPRVQIEGSSGSQRQPIKPGIQPGPNF